MLNATGTAVGHRDRPRFPVHATGTGIASATASATATRNRNRQHGTTNKRPRSQSGCGGVLSTQGLYQLISPDGTSAPVRLLSGTYWRSSAPT